MKSLLEKNTIEMYSTHNEGKSVITERIIRTSKSKTYKYMASLSKNVYIDKLDDIFDKYNNTDHRPIKMKPVDLKSNTYIHSSKVINDKDPNLKLVIFLKYQNIKTFFTKGYFRNWSEEVSVIKNLKTLYRGNMLSVTLKRKKLLGRFTKNNCKTQIKKSLEISNKEKRR